MRKHLAHGGRSHAAVRNEVPAMPWVGKVVLGARSSDNDGTPDCVTSHRIASVSLSP